jgi:hypothetical protein
MRFLCITQNHDSDTTALSQPGLQKQRGEALERRRFLNHGQVHCSAFHSGQAIFLVFPT